MSMKSIAGLSLELRVLSMSQTELFNHLTVCKQMADIKLNC